jgi:c-di-GMP-binding flagellar brake protein YcgR
MFGFIKELGKLEVEYNDTDTDENKISFKSYVKSVESDYILIDFLFYKGAEYNIPVENQIKVKFKEITGVYSGNCQILGRDDSKLPGIKISFPTDIKFIQQREYIRVPLKLKMELVVFIDEEGKDVKIYNINTLDISGSGFCFVSDEPIEKHSKIIGTIIFCNSAEEPIEIFLKHIYSKKFIAAGKERYKNALTFIDMNEKLREKILKEIFLYELEMRKKRI